MRPQSSHPTHTRTHQSLQSSSIVCCQSLCMFSHSVVFVQLLILPSFHSSLHLCVSSSMHPVTRLSLSSCSSFPPSIHPSNHPVVHSFVHPSILSSMCLSSHACICPVKPSPFHPSSHPLIHPFIKSIMHSFNDSAFDPACVHPC